MSDTAASDNALALASKHTVLPVRTGHLKPPRLSDILLIAFPMVVSQASETINLFVDRLFLSRLGKLHFTGSMTGGLAAICVTSLFVGVISYTGAIVAQHDGAGDKKSCARATAQALQLAIVGWPLVFLTIPLIRIFFNAIGHIPEQVAMEMAYFRILVLGAILEMSRHALAGFFIGLGKTRIVMLANLAGVLVNIPANWVLIFGHLGFPALGISGAALGTLAGRGTILAILGLVYFSRTYRKEYGTSRELGFDKRLSKLLLKYGAPAGGEFFLNITAFNLFIQLLYSYGPNVAASVTIVFNYDMLAFIPMMGFGFASTTLAGRYMGARDVPSVKKAVYLNLLTAGTYALFCLIVFVFAAGPLVNFFAHRLENSGAEVAPMAKIMLRLAAVYVLSDATQLILAGALKGAGDTKFVMRISAVLHWGFAGIVWYAVKVAQISPLAIWGFFIIFALSIAVAMFLRYKTGKWQEFILVHSP